MEQQHPTRPSPPEGFSVALQAMEDAVTFDLSHGNITGARAHAERLASELKFYPDIDKAYAYALDKVAAAEKAEQLKAEEQRQLQLRDLMAMMSVMQPKIDKPPAPRTASQGGVQPALPPVLATEKAMKLWHRLQQAGFVDENFQPIELSRTESAVLASLMATQLNISRNKWKPFEILWVKNNMRMDYDTALNQRKTNDFIGKVKTLLAD